MKPKYLIWTVIVVIIGAMVIYMWNANLPGKREQTGDVITETLGTSEPNASSTFQITLQGEGDPAHEVDHVFEAIKNAAIATGSFDVKTRRLVVRYDNSLITEADVRQLLLQARYITPTTADAVLATLSSDGKSQELTIAVGEKLDPPLLRAKAGIPLKLKFGEGSNHLASITIAELGVKQDLSNGGATVEVKDPKPGTYNIVCAENYPDGTLIVE